MHLKVTVSIGMPVYNGGKSLRTALDSLLSQTFTDFELIISDNDSNDETEIMCREYEKLDKRIRYIRQKTNIGAMPNFQFVLDNATGDYFMWASHDDYWYEDFIAKNLNNLLKHERAVGSISNVMLRNKYGRERRSGADKSIMGTKLERLKKFIIYPNDNSRFYSLFKRIALKELNLKKYNFHTSDWFVTFKILLHGDLLNINEFGTRWSVSDSMKRINEEGKGIILLIDGENQKQDEFHEINASKKIRITAPNNDPRRIGIGSQILRDLGVKKIKLMGSEVRYPSLSGFDLEVTEYIKK